MKHQVTSRQDERMTTPGGKSVPPRVFLLTGILCLCFGLVSCGDQEQPARQAPPVTVGKPVVTTIRVYQIFTGSSRAIKSADVVARVAGALETMDFEASSPSREKKSRGCLSLRSRTFAMSLSSLSGSDALPREARTRLRGWPSALRKDSTSCRSTNAKR